VERDQVAIWWFNRIPRPEVDLDSFGDPYLDELRRYLSSVSRELWVLDVTADLGIPVVVALSRLAGGGGVMFGFGSHLDARIALLRAVTELNQKLAFALGPGRGAFAAHGNERSPSALSRWEVALDENPHLLPAGPARGAADFPTLWTDDIAADVELCRRAVEAHGMEVLVLDQTRADVGLPVVRVVVPGMRHFWPRFAPGRLYDVPVQLGWLSEPLTEERLNPTVLPA
jgi:ribosomal protein S12 methylthiotransferase accessory factor